MAFMLGLPYVQLLLITNKFPLVLSASQVRLDGVYMNSYWNAGWQLTVNKGMDGGRLVDSANTHIVHVPLGKGTKNQLPVLGRGRWGRGRGSC